jgi:hypothetical protein
MTLRREKKFRFINPDKGGVLIKDGQMPLRDSQKARNLVFKMRHPRKATRSVSSPV